MYLHVILLTVGETKCLEYQNMLKIFLEYQDEEISNIQPSGEIIVTFEGIHILIQLKY